jgi:NTE family protein
MKGSERKRVGLALSGGVMRGPAHIGVVMTLGQAGIPIDCVTGVSAGSIIGSVYCAGIGTDRMIELARQIGWRRIASLVWPREGFISFAKLARWLIALIGDRCFEELALPFAVGTTDLKTGEPLVIQDGKVAVAVHASCAVPGFVVPVRYRGRILGDGGVSNNLPGAAARALGADYVIGVDLMQPELRRRGGPFRYGAGALETLVQRSGGGLDVVDCLIKPELAGVSYFDFSQFDELVDRGRRAAEAQLDTIRAGLQWSPPA